MAQGDTDVAVQLFKGAFDASPQSNAARSLYNHAEVIGENPATAPCRVTALGRPRPFSGQPRRQLAPRRGRSGEQRPRRVMGGDRRRP